MEIPKYFIQNSVSSSNTGRPNEFRFESRNDSASKFVKGRIRAEGDTIRIDVISSNYEPNYLRRKLKNKFPHEQIVDIKMIDYEFNDGNQIFFDRDQIDYIPVLNQGEIYEISSGSCPLYFKDGYVSCNETYPLENDIEVIYIGDDASNCIDPIGRVGRERKAYEIFEFVRIL